MVLGGRDHNERKIIEAISTVNLLEDKAFKIALSDEGTFRSITKEITGRELHDGKFNYNGEILVTVRNKKIILDNLAKTDKEWVDIEGQQETDEFPFERHLYYWSMIYSQSLLSGMRYSDLIPVTVIVIYKDKGKCGLIEEAVLEGELARSTAKRDHLRLIAVNTAKWKDSASINLKRYLYLLHKGFEGMHTPESCKEVDFTSDDGSSIWYIMRNACASSLMEKAEKEGDEEMVNSYTRFITEEKQKEILAKGRAEGIAKGREEGKIEGIAEGEIKGKIKGEITALYQIAHMTVTEIAERLKMTEEEVQKHLTEKSGS